MIEPTSCSIEFKRQSNASCNTGNDAKEETDAEAITDAKHNRIGYRAGKQPQRTVLSA